MGNKSQLATMLADVRLFSKCTDRERSTIARHAQIAELPNGTDLVRVGEAGDALFVILEGTGEVLDGDQVVNQVGAGSYFGELAILDGGPRSATVRATSDVKVAVIGIRMFRTLLREFPELAEQLLIGLAGELRAARAGVGAPA